MKPLHHEILEFALDRIGGQTASDEKFIEASDACLAASIGLMAAVRSNRARELALAERDAKAADLIRTAARVLEAAVHGEVQLETRSTQ
jgi:hypothetical protein